MFQLPSLMNWLVLEHDMLTKPQDFLYYNENLNVGHLHHYDKHENFHRTYYNYAHVFNNYFRALQRDGRS